jgi:hypothetical protein
MAYRYHTKMVSLYRKPSDLKKALILVTKILNEEIGSTFKKNKDDFFSINEVCWMMREKEPDLNYINRNHIVELFFKDQYRKIIISGLDNIKYRKVKYVSPPTILYFGTIESLVDKMMKQGLNSSSKGYIKLYGTIDKAVKTAEKFSSKNGEAVKIISVKAKEAFNTGLKFSTYNPDEYIVPEIEARYIKEIVR